MSIPPDTRNILCSAHRAKREPSDFLMFDLLLTLAQNSGSVQIFMSKLGAFGSPVGGIFRSRLPQTRRKLRAYFPDTLSLLQK